MDNIVIKEMTLAHLDSIKNILEKEFDNFWNYNIFKSELNNKNSKYIIAEINNEIVGFAGISLVLDTADITNIVVKKDFRGKGISTILLENIINLAKSNNCHNVNLEVNSTNVIAINLYKKFGFNQVGCRKNYYNEKDGLLFSKIL